MGKIVAMRAETNQISQAMDMIAVRKAEIDLPSLQPNRRKVQEANETFPKCQSTAVTTSINVAASLDTPERTAKRKSTSASQTRVRMVVNVWIR
jgi:hypothetical protein